MFPRIILQDNGQELQQADVNELGLVASNADDHVLAELLRAAPFTSGSPTKLILPYGHTGDTATATVSGATGGVTVSPFKAVVGSRDTFTNIGADNWKDARTQAFVGSSALNQFVSLAAFTGGPSTGRWDLIYAQVTVDANAAAVTRYVKDPTTKNIAATNVVTQVNTTVSVQTVTGVVNASPVQPSIPADSAGVFNIPLAYIALTNSFSGATVVSSFQIDDVSPTPALYRHMGLLSMKPASSLFTSGGPVITGAKVNSWASGGNRPDAYMPPSMAGGESLLFFLNTNGVSASQATQTVVDDSRNWRNRAFLTFTQAYNSVSGTTAWAASSTPFVPTETTADAFITNMGQSFFNDGAAITEIGVSSGKVMRFSPDGGTHFISLYVDYADNKLKVAYSGGTTAIVFVWIMSTTNYPNK